MTGPVSGLLLIEIIRIPFGKEMGREFKKVAKQGEKQVKCFLSAPVRKVLNFMQKRKGHAIQFCRIYFLFFTIGYFSF